jgi:hypothetical protein
MTSAKMGIAEATLCRRKERYPDVAPYLPASIASPESWLLHFGAVLAQKTCTEVILKIHQVFTHLEYNRIGG